MAQKSWAIEAVMGVDLKRRGIKSALNPSRFGGELAPIVGLSGHDRVAIRPRSNRDREPRSRLSFNRLSDSVGRDADDVPTIVALISPQRDHDRAMIETDRVAIRPRSCADRGS